MDEGLKDGLVGLVLIFYFGYWGWRWLKRWLIRHDRYKESG